ncbi:MAG: acyl carrier protein [Planctomycetes bacterium]|nr:acyl carrier protein [Planctomycetota bacterium]
MVMSREDVFGKVQEVLVEALGVDDDEITEGATLQGDLDAESIDFLDIVFRLEKAFTIKIPRGELFPDDILSNPDYVEGGKLTPEGLTKLKEGMPHADFSDFEGDPDVSRMPDLFTVRTIINYVEGKLNHDSAASTA